MQEMNISTAEWEVMRVVWANQKTTSKEISDILRQKMDWKTATTKTLLGRLVKKNMLGTEPQGRKYIYYPTVTEEESVQNASEELFSQVCSTKMGQTLASIVEDTLLSQEDIEELQNILETKKETAPKAISCNCTPGQCDCNIERGHSA